jgi:hypothetical protein
MRTEHCGVSVSALYLNVNRETSCPYRIFMPNLTLFRFMLKYFFKRSCAMNEVSDLKIWSTVSDRVRFVVTSVKIHICGCFYKYFSYFNFYKLSLVAIDAYEQNAVVLLHKFQHKRD